jgi:ABC-type sugar transport system ATPase subunit
MSSITLTGIGKSYGRVTVLQDVDLAIRDGELIVFVGPSGCGKSTLLRIIAGLDQPSTGEIRIDEAVVNAVSAADRGLAMVFQSYALYPHMSVRQNLAFGLENSRMARPEIAQRVAEAARMLEIEPYLERRPGQLSGGQRQRVAIGRAIVRQPVAFLLDEPLSNLDAELRLSTRAELAALHARLKTTMVYVTHDQVEAMTLADRIVVLRAGRIEQVGSPLELYNAPANRFVAGFIGAPQMNFLSGKIVAAEGGSATVRLAAGADLVFSPLGKIAPGDMVSVGVRPHHVRLATEGGGLMARVKLVEQLGAETVVHAEANGQNLLAVVPGQHHLGSGDSVGLSLTAAPLHIFAESGERLSQPNTAG